MKKYLTLDFNIIDQFKHTRLISSRNFLITLLALVISIYLGYGITIFPFGFRAALALVVVILIYLIWGPFGFLAGLIAFAPLDWEGFNINRIPLLGSFFPEAGIRPRLVILIGGIYIFYKIIEYLRSKNQLHLFPFLPVFLIGAFGALTAFIFALQLGLYGSNWYVRYILYGLVMYTLVYLMVNNLRQAKILFICLIISGIFFSVIVKMLPGSIVMLDNNVQNGWYQGDGRLSGIWLLPLGFQIFANPIFISTYMAFSSILAWGKFLFAKNNLIKVLLLAFIGLMTYVNLTTVSRTGIYGLLIGVAFMTFIYILNVNWKSKLIVLSSLVSLIIVLAISYNFFINTSSFGSLANRLYSLQENSQIRLDLINKSINISLQNPMGEGPEALLIATSVPQHSLHTMLLAGLGWFGFFTLVLLVCWCIKPLLIFNKADSSIFEFQLSLLGVFLAVFIMGFGHSFLDTTWGTVLFWCSLGLAATINKLDKDKLISGEINI